jgi:TRAP-type C4-dicarboxylate transport system permease large subunit
LGIATPTEASAAAAFLAMLLALPKIIHNRSILTDALRNTVSVTCMLFAIMIGASLLSLFMILAGVPQMMVEWVVGLDVSRGVILALCLLIWLPLGTLLDSMSIMLITLPIVYPVIRALGYDGIWFGVITVKCIEMDLLTPPVAMNIMVVKGVASDVPLQKICLGVIPFIVCDIVMVVLFTIFPQIVLWLPSQMAQF